MLLDFEDIQRVDGPGAQAAGDGRLAWGFLVHWPLELRDDRVEVGGRGPVESEDRDVPLAGVVEHLRGAGGVTEEDGQTAGDLRVQRARMGGAFLAGQVTDPRGDLVGRGAGWLVEVDDAEREQFLDGALVGRAAERSRHLRSRSRP